MFLRNSGCWLVIAVGEVDPNSTVCFAWIRSGKFLMPWRAPIQTPQLAMSRCVLPIHSNLRGSYVALVFPNSGSNAVEEANTPSTEPSAAATLKMALATFMEPAPGRFCTTIVGLPGMCLPKCCASRRVVVS